MKLNLVRFLGQSVVIVGLITLGAGLSQAGTAGGLLFKAKCAACHGADGKGEVPVGKKLGARDLSSAEVQGQSDAQLTDVVTKGKNKMPSYDGKLTKEQIGELIEHVRELGKKN